MTGQACQPGSPNLHVWAVMRRAFRAADSAAIVLPTKRTMGREDHHMPTDDIRATSRRRFLQYCAASPLLASGAFAAKALEAPSKLPDPMTWAPPGSIDVIKSQKNAINEVAFE